MLKKFIFFLLILSFVNSPVLSEDLEIKAGKITGGRYPPIISAAGDNDIQRAEVALKKGASLYATSLGGQNALHLAVYTGSNDMVKWLLARDVHPLIPTSNGQTAIELAKEKGGNTEKIISDFIEHIKSAGRLVDKNNIEALDELLKSDIRNFNSLHVCTLRNSYECIRKALSTGNNVNGKSKLLTTPLHHAAVRGNVRTVKLLLENGADINAKTIYGVTPLFYALIKKKNDVAELLINSGADLKSTNRFPLVEPKSILEAAEYNGNKKILLQVLKTHNKCIKIDPLALC